MESSFLNRHLLEYWPIVVGAVAAYLVAASIYRLYFHPLSGFPGPKLAGLTWYYQGYYELLLDGGLIDQLEILHKQYGPIVRIGPNDLHFSDPRVYNSIYTVGSKFHKDPKFYDAFGESESSVGLIDPQQAKIRREALLPFFSRRAIFKLENVIQERLDKFISQLLSPQYHKKPVNLYIGFRAATLDIISSYCFAHCYEAVLAPNFEHPFLMSMEATIPMWWVFKYIPVMNFMLGLPDWLTVLLTPSMQGFVDLRKTMTAQLEGILNDPTSLEHSEHEIIYHHLLTPKKGQTEIPSKKSLLEEAINLMLAGSDTVGNASTVGTFHILNSPIVLQKLRNELHEAWPDKDTPMHFETLEKLPYLTAVIKEALRLSLGVPVPLPRVVGPRGVKADIGGTIVPAGMVVSMGASFVHYNEELFPDPYTFNPDRWLQEDSRALDNYLVAFSRGPRSCLGLNLAWCELYLIFANLFRKVNMEIYKTTLEDMKIRAHFIPVYRGRPLMAIVTPRE